MFYGEFRHNLDDRDRVAMPSKFRTLINEVVILTKGLDGCLFVYTKKEWEKIVAKLALLPLTKSDARAFVRHMMAGAYEVEIDGQGRVLIPSYLKEFAQIKKEIVIVGVHERMEFWSALKWKKYNNNENNLNFDLEKSVEDLNF